MSGSLQNKVALVTGAGSGIGRALALALAGEGCSLVLVSRTAAALEKVSQEAAPLTNGEVLVQPGDVGDQAAMERLQAAVKEAFGRLDILVNSAGQGLSGTILESDPGQVKEMLAVNIFGVYLVTRLMLPLMSRGGDVVNISSVAGLKYSPGFAMYSASKFAVKAFSEALRNEVQEQGVRVLTLYPGMTQTPMVQGFTGAGAPLAVQEGRELISPQEVAQAVVYALKQPSSLAINEIVIQPSWQER